MDRIKPWHLIALAVFVAVCIGGGVAAWALLRDEESIDTSEIEDAIRIDAAAQGDISADDITVTCPATIEWRVGEAFRCIAEDADDNRVRITVYMESKDGSYSWSAE